MPASASRTFGIFDLGSNSIKMMVAREHPGKSPEILAEKSVGTRLGERQEGATDLTDAAIQRTLEAMVAFREQHKDLHITQWKAVATSAVREASNRHVLEQRFEEILGFPLSVISGEEEANLIYLGVTRDKDLVPKDARLLVMDSGGGSAEWICGTPDHIERRISLDLGCVRMTRRFLKGDPYTKESHHALIEHYHAQLEPLVGNFSAKDHLMIGTGGSICTAAAIDLAAPHFHHKKIHGHVMKRHEIHELDKKLRAMTNSERLALQGMPGKRADIIVAGIALFVVAMKLFDAHHITSSLRGLRYGVLAKELAL